MFICDDIHFMADGGGGAAAKSLSSIEPRVEYLLAFLNRAILMFLPTYPITDLQLWQRRLGEHERKLEVTYRW